MTDSTNPENAQAFDAWFDDFLDDYSPYDHRDFHETCTLAFELNLSAARRRLDCTRSTGHAVRPPTGIVRIGRNIRGDCFERDLGVFPHLCRTLDGD